MSDRYHVVRRNRESADELEALVCGREVAGEELLLPDLRALRLVVRALWGRTQRGEHDGGEPGDECESRD